MELAELMATDPEALSPAELSAYTARWDAIEGWRESGCRSAKAWLVHNTTVSAAAAAARRRVAGQLAQMAEVAAAAADLGWEKVRLLAQCQSAHAECFACNETLLVEKARTPTVDQMARALEFWRRHANPDGTDPGASERSTASVARYGEDRRRLMADLTAEDGGVVEGAIERIRAEIWRSASGEERNDTTPAQLAGQALVEMARRALGFDPDKGQPGHPARRRRHPGPAWSMAPTC